MPRDTSSCDTSSPIHLQSESPSKDLIGIHAAVSRLRGGGALADSPIRGHCGEPPTTVPTATVAAATAASRGPRFHPLLKDIASPIRRPATTPRTRSRIRYRKRNATAPATALRTSPAGTAAPYPASETR